MTEYQRQRNELDEWLEINKTIKNEPERKVFFEEIERIIISKNREEMLEHLIALKDSVFDLGKRVDIALSKGSQK